MSNSKKVLVVAETSHIIRKGLVYVLSQLSMVSKVVELRDMSDIASQLERLHPDGVIINPMLLGYTSRHDIKQQIKLPPQTAIVALVYNMIDEQFYKFYDGVIQINDSDAKIESILSGCFDRAEEGGLDQNDLSEREREILVSVVKGMSNKEIADFHNISIHTVITHRRNIGRKLNVKSVSGLTIYAILNKLVDITDIKID